MRKYLLLVTLFLIHNFYSYCQWTGDSSKIDNLKKTLTTLSDTARINCLNELAKAFIYRQGYNLKTKSDSAYPYAVMANSEATQSNYKYGIAYSLVNLCYVYYFKISTSERLSNDFTVNLNKWETYQKQLLKLAQQINDPELLGQTYSPLYSVLLALQNKSQEANAATEIALTWYKKSGNEQKESEVSQYHGYQFYIDGEYEKAFDYFNRSLQLARKNYLKGDRDDWSNQMIQWGLRNMSDIYEMAGDYETALKFLRESRHFHATHATHNTWNTSGMEAELADMFLKSGQYDSAFYYLKPLFTNYNSADILLLPILADAYLMTGKYDSASKCYDRLIDFLKPKVEAGYDPLNLVRCYIGKAKVLQMRHYYKDALGYAKKSYTYARHKANILESYDLLSQCFHQLGENDSAYFYMRKYTKLKDSIITRQFLWRLNSYKKQAEEERKTSQINLLNKDNQIKEQKLKQEAFAKNGLLIGIILLFLLGVFIFRSLLLKRKNERLRMVKDLEILQLESEKKQAELEMQALRAQMNPHFIFNCLSSINRFILKNESKIASNYLTRFSRLMRMVLNNSQKPLISLDDELEMLELYLEMERLRFKNSFDYGITFLNTVDSDNIFIPPLLLQPFCENAIWHGLMNKEGQGRLDIELSMENNILNCEIRDNGVGREKAEELKSKSAEKEKSMGLKITTERLALLNSEKGLHTFYKIEDLEDENGNTTGTKVNLRIKFKESAEQFT